MPTACTRHTMLLCLTSRTKACVTSTSAPLPETKTPANQPAPVLEPGKLPALSLSSHLSRQLKGLPKIPRWLVYAFSLGSPECPEMAVSIYLLTRCCYGNINHKRVQALAFAVSSYLPLLYHCLLKPKPCNLSISHQFNGS